VVCRKLASTWRRAALGIKSAAISPEVPGSPSTTGRPPHHSRRSSEGCVRLPGGPHLDVADFNEAIETSGPTCSCRHHGLRALAVAEASALPWASGFPTRRGMRAPGYLPTAWAAPWPVPRARPATRDGREARADSARVMAGGERRAPRRGLADCLTEPDEILLRPPLLLYLTAVAIRVPRPSWPVSFASSGPARGSHPRPLRPGSSTEYAHRARSTSTAYQNDGRLVTNRLRGSPTPRRPPHLWRHSPRAILVTTIRRPTAVLIGSWLTASSSARRCSGVHAGMGNHPVGSGLRGSPSVQSFRTRSVRGGTPLEVSGAGVQPRPPT